MPPTRTNGQQILDQSITESDLSFSDVTTLDASTTAHGLLKKLPNDATKFFGGDGNWDTLAISDVANLQTNLDSKQNRHGFENKTDSALSFVNATRTFSITGVNFKVWNNGSLQLKNTESIQIPTTAGAYFVYYNSSNVLTQNTSSWAIGVDMPIALIIWNGSEGLIAEERHGLFDPQTHKWAHSVFHTMYASGLTGTFANATFSVDSGKIFDEDIEISIPTTTQSRIFYRSGSNITWTAQQTNYNLISGTMQYDNAGTLTSVISNNYIAIWCYATDLINDPIVFVLGQRQDNTIANARANNTPEGLNTSYLPLPEMKLLYRIIVKNDATPYEEVTDYRLTSVTGSSYGVIDHQALTNRSAIDAHPIASITDLQTNLDAKQATLVNQSNLKSVEGVSLLGSGDLVFSRTIFPTIVVSGEIKVAVGDTDYICPLIVSVPSGYTATLKNIRYRINGGTSASFRLQKNGADVTSYGTSGSPLSCTTTATTTTADATLANNDELTLLVSAVSGTPKNLSCRLEILLSKA